MSSHELTRSGARLSVLGSRNDMGASLAPRCPIPKAGDAIVYASRGHGRCKAWLKSDPSFWAEGASSRKAVDLLRQTYRPRLDDLHVEGTRSESQE